MTTQPASGETPTLVIVCGLPATGKSGLAELLRDELGWPLFAKDGFKELLYDAIDRCPNSFTREDSMMLGKQSIALLYSTAREVLETGNSCIIEGNFLPNLARQDMGPLLQVANGRQVHCAIPDSLALQRYRDRAESGDRHPVHVDGSDLDGLVQRIEDGAGKPLPLDIPLLPVDCTDGYDPNLAAIVAFCRS